MLPVEVLTIFKRYLMENGTMNVKDEKTEIGLYLKHGTRNECKGKKGQLVGVYS